MRPRPNHLARSGFTLAELICATAMLGIVLMAASALISATAAGWKHSDAAYRVANLGDRAGSRVEESLAGALSILQVKSPGGAAASHVFYWKADGITGAEDGKAQLGEMALIEFDPTEKAIRLYEPIPVASMNAEQLALATGSDWGDPTSPAVVTYFKTMSFLAAAQPLIGGKTGSSTVTSATFVSYAPVGAKPAVSYAIALTQNGLAATRQGTITLRAARKPKNI